MNATLQRSWFEKSDRNSETSSCCLTSVSEVCLDQFTLIRCHLERQQMADSTHVDMNAMNSPNFLIDSDC